MILNDYRVYMLIYIRKLSFICLLYFCVAYSAFADFNGCIDSSQLREYDQQYISKLTNALQTTDTEKSVYVDILRDYSCGFDALCESIYSSYYIDTPFPSLYCQSEAEKPLQCGAFTPTEDTISGLLAQCRDFSQRKIEAMTIFTEQEIQRLETEKESSEISFLWNALVSSWNRVSNGFHHARILLADIFESITCRCDP